eukprot:g1120.t1
MGHRDQYWTYRVRVNITDYMQVVKPSTLISRFSIAVDIRWQGATCAKATNSKLRTRTFQRKTIFKLEDGKHKLNALRPARFEAGREYGLLGELIYSEQLDLGRSHLLILARTYFQDFVWSGRKEAQPGRSRGQEQIEKEGECKSKEASVKQGRRTKKHTYAVVQVSENSGEKETEAGNAPSAMAKAKRSRPPSKKVLGNAEQ